MLSIALLVACTSDSSLDRVKAAPTASISAPVDQEVFRQDAAPIVFTGQVGDEHTQPPELLAEWILDDGTPIPVTPDTDGNVQTVWDASLELGTHTLDLHVEDEDGDTNYASVDFIVEGPLGPPTVEITSPEDGLTWPVGNSITFVGVASDVTTPADDLSFAWASDLDGALEGAISGDGQSALITSTLTEGTHVITLAATDLDGEIGTDAITVTIGNDDPVPPEPGDLIFSEVMVNPNVVADEDGEWVELYNTSGSTLDLATYSFHDDGTDYWVFDASVLVAPHDYVVICANPNPKQNGGIACDAWFYRNPNGDEPTAGMGHGSGIAIANNDDELTLTGPDGIDIDRFDYDDTDSDPIEAAMSFGVDPTKLDGVSNDDVGNWCVQTTILAGATEPGTPGVANDGCF